MLFLTIVDMVEKSSLMKADLESEDEIEQIKSSCSKLIDQYEVAFVSKHWRQRRFFKEIT